MRPLSHTVFRLRSGFSAGAIGALVLCWIPVASSAHGTHGQLMAAIEKQLEGDPGNANLWHQKAFLNLEHEDPAHALEDLEKAERLAPGKLPTFLLRGQALESCGKFIEAKAALDTHILRFPNQATGYTSRARVLTKLRFPEDAMADYRTALSKSPDAEPDLVHEAAVSLAANGREDEAIRVLETGLNRLGNIPSLLIKTLEIEMKFGRFDSAIARVDAVMKSAPRPEPWMAKRAELLELAHRPEESRAAWLALIGHLKNLPHLERRSNAMSLLAERAHKALKSVESTDRCPASNLKNPTQDPTQ